MGMSPGMVDIMNTTEHERKQRRRRMKMPVSKKPAAKIKKPFALQVEVKRMVTINKFTTEYYARKHKKELEIKNPDKFYKVKKVKG